MDTEIALIIEDDIAPVIDDNVPVIEDNVLAVPVIEDNVLAVPVIEDNVPVIEDNAVPVIEDNILPVEDTIKFTEPIIVPVIAGNKLTVIDPFKFMRDPIKLQLLKDVNKNLNINNSQNNRLVFVYSAPKVGSTTIVSSLRIFCSDKMDIIHIHDEEMLRVLGNMSGITINEIIMYNKQLGKDVYVIDVFRSPIERKISAYFEKIGAYHFNNVDEEVNKYEVRKIINRFNNIFPYISLGDHFIDKYNIDIPDKFDYINKYLLVRNNGIQYIKLRLKDSNIWGNILTFIFKTKICIIKDYESANKPIKELYKRFKENYKIPENLLKDIMECKYLNYYYSEIEKNQYFNEWSIKSTNNSLPYTPEQYHMYEELTMENSHIDYIQINHYIDEGCICKACKIKRYDVATNIMRGNFINKKITHIEAKQELMQKTVIRVNNINNVIKRMPKKANGVNFKNNMTSIVNGKKF